MAPSSLGKLIPKRDPNRLDKKHKQKISKWVYTLKICIEEFSPDWKISHLESRERSKPPRWKGSLDQL